MILYICRDENQKLDQHMYIMHNKRDIFMMMCKLMQMNVENIDPGEAREKQITHRVAQDRLDKVAGNEAISEMHLFRHDLLPRCKIGRVDARVPVWSNHLLVGLLISRRRRYWP